MEPSATLQLLALALGVGLLVGLERGWQARTAPPGTRVAGFRTFGLLGLAGGVSALAPPLLAAVLLVGAAVLLLLGYVRSSAAPDALSATSALAGLLTLALGWLAASGLRAEALAGAAVMTLLLALRHRSHAFLRGLSEPEVEAVARFAIIALVILPLMPDRAMGPLEAWNPQRLWFVVVLVSGISFLGYAAARRMGPGRGLIATAAVAGLVSSTAVTVAYARRLREADGVAGPLVAGIAVANSVMFGRVLLLSAMLAPAALASLCAVVVPAGLVQGGFALWRLRMPPGGEGAGEVRLGNPLDLRPALALAGFVAALAVASRWLLERFGDAGVGVLLLLTGLVEVDAAIITLAGLPPAVVEPGRAGLLLALPVLANTALKAAVARAIAGGRKGGDAALPLLASLAAGCAGLALALGLGLA